MPKKPRQNHIPSQPKRRRVRRPLPFMTGSSTSAVLEPETEIEQTDQTVATQSAPRQRRRLDMVRAPQETLGVRVVPGQLPTFDRAYLMRELRLIGLTSSILLACIIVLTIVLR